MLFLNKTHKALTMPEQSAISIKLQTLESALKNQEHLPISEADTKCATAMISLQKTIQESPVATSKQELHQLSQLLASKGDQLEEIASRTSSLFHSTLHTVPGTSDTKINDVKNALLDHCTQSVVIELNKWATEGDPSEKRMGAKNRILACIQNNSVTLNLSSLGLTTLPDIFNHPSFQKHLQAFDCHKNRLQALPDTLGNCTALKELFCFGNELQSLPDTLGNCTALLSLCCNSNQLQALPDTLGNCTALTHLNCSGNNLQALPDTLGNCIALQSLKCFKNQLHALPDTLGNCTALLSLCCSDNLPLTHIPASLPHCVHLDCLDCPLIQVLPQLPPTATVRHGSSSSQNTTSRLRVDIETLQSNPQKYLVELGKTFLLQGKPFPSVDYFEGGVLSAGIDAGGLRRDFLTRLFQGLFLSQVGTLPVISREGGIWPGMDQNPDTEISYKTIARIMALCYSNTASFKIGEVFTPMLFSAITVPGIGEKTDDALIQGFLLSRGYPANTSYKGEGSLESTELAQAKALGYDGEDKAGFRAYLLGFAKEDSFLQVASIIAKELKVYLGDKWSAFILEDKDVLSNKIQGTFSKELLLQSINWNTSTQAANALGKNTEFFTQWVNGAPEETVRSFLQAVTGNRVLGPGSSFSIRLYDDENPGALPHCHACSQELVLPGTYDNQETFNEKMNVFVANALAGTGFQFG